MGGVSRCKEDNYKLRQQDRRIIRTVRDTSKGWVKIHRLFETLVHIRN